MYAKSALTLGAFAPSDLTLGEEYGAFAPSDLTMGQIPGRGTFFSEKSGRRFSRMVRNPVYSPSDLTLGQASTEAGPFIPEHLRPAGAAPPLISDSKSKGVKLMFDEAKAFLSALTVIYESWLGIASVMTPTVTSRKLTDYLNSISYTVRENMDKLPEDEVSTTNSWMGNLTNDVNALAEFIGANNASGVTAEANRAKAKELYQKAAGSANYVISIFDSALSRERKKIFFMGGAAVLGLGFLAVGGKPKRKRRARKSGRKKSRRRRRR